MWLYTLLNIYGVKGAGLVNLIMTIIKLIPLLLFFIIAILHFDSANISTVSDTAETGAKAIPLQEVWISAVWQDHLHLLLM